MRKMIGQKQSKEKIKNLIDNNKFPRFCLLVGDKGSGKKLLANWIGEQLGYTVDMRSVDVDSVRDVIEQSYSTMQPMLYVFADADNMSLAAKNALLKVTEEPPNNARFIMTLTNTENTLPTIRSRAFSLYMDAYSSKELLEYYHENYDGKSDAIIDNYCTTMGDIDLLCAYGEEEFSDYVTMVVEHIDKVSGSNSFKIAQKLDLGTDEKKYDLALFWKAFRALCTNNLRIMPFKYISGVTITSKYLSELRIAGVNKQMCFDNWLLDIRKEWMQYAKD